MRSYPLLKIPTIADPAHVSGVMYVLRFIQVTNLLYLPEWFVFKLNKQITVALAVFMFILNISVEQTKFQYNGGSISNINLTTTLSIDIYDSGQCKVIHPSSDLHVICICTPIHVFKKIYLAFCIENWMLQRYLRRNSKVFAAFYDIHIVK